MYKIFVKWAGGAEVDFKKIMTPNALEAEKVFRDLMKDKRFWCYKAAAVLSHNNTQLEYRRFDSMMPADPKLELAVKNGKWQPPKGIKFFHFPDERDLADQMNPDDYLFIYRDRETSTSLILDDETPINLGL